MQPLNLIHLPVHWAVILTTLWAAGAAAQTLPPGASYPPAGSYQATPQPSPYPPPQATYPSTQAAPGAGAYPATETTLPIDALPPGAYIGGVDQVQPAWDDPIPSPGQRSPGIRRAVYSVDSVIPVITREFMLTSVYLPPCEVITDLLLGDPALFRIHQPRENLVTVFPRQPHADSNLEIVTKQGLIYTFYLRSTSTDAEQLPDLRVHVDAPGLCNGAPGTGRGQEATRPAAPEPQTAGQYRRVIPFDPKNLNFDSYGILIAEPDDALIAPERVWDDGVFTYLDFGARADSLRWPAVFRLQDGVDTPVNTWVTGERGQILVVEALGDLSLKHGQQIVCLRYSGPSTSLTAQYAPAVAAPAPGPAGER